MYVIFLCNVCRKLFRIEKFIVIYAQDQVLDVGRYACRFCVNCLWFLSEFTPKRNQLILISLNSTVSSFTKILSTFLEIFNSHTRADELHFNKRPARLQKRPKSVVTLTIKCKREISPISFIILAVTANLGC